MQQFCKFVKIDFQQSMVNWLSPPMDQAHLFELEAFKKAGNTTSFGAPSPAADLEDLLDDIQVAVRNAMPIYKYLKETEADEAFQMDTEMPNGTWTYLVQFYPLLWD